LVGWLSNCLLPTCRGFRTKRQPTLAARARLLGSTKAGENDPNDALATAIAGLRHCGLRAVRVENHSAVIRMLIDRYDDLVALRTQAPPVGCMSPCGSSTPAARPAVSGLIGPRSCSAASAPRVLPGFNASDPPSRCWPTSVASTATSPRRRSARAPGRAPA